jgi:hypothetical protein
MSEINELIATSSTHAYNSGIDAERQRIVRILNGKVVDALFYGQPATATLLKEAIAEINATDYTVTTLQKIQGENHGKDGRAARAAN